MAPLLTLEAPTITLRDYQEEAIARVLDAWTLPARRALVVLPTGAGKTIIFASLLKRLNEPALILAHREELLTQAREKIHWIWPEADVGLISGNLGLDEPGHQITIASVPSVIRPQRLRTLAESGIQTVIVDECHHSAARSYRTILNELHAGVIGGTKLLGVTATPDRGDKLTIEPIFGRPVFSLPLDLAIAAGHLAPLTGIVVQTGTNLDGVRTRMGDFVEHELAQAVSTIARNDEIVWSWLTHAKGRPTLCFTVNVQHAHDLAATFRSAGVKAAVLDGTMPREDRQRILQQYHAGELEVVCNCNILTEGFDAPSTACIITARPTKSRPLYAQCLDTQTEILTPDGWKGRNAIQIGDLVAGFDVTTGAIRWIPAQDKVVRPLGEDEPLYHLVSPSLDIRVTGGHRMVYRTRFECKARFGRKHLRTEWSFEEAQKLAERTYDYDVPIAGLQEAPGVPLTDDELHFIGWYLTDGSYNPKTGLIAITQALHQPHHAAIRACLEGCGFKYSVYERIPKTQFHATSNQLIYALSKGQPRGRDKHLTGWGRLEPYITKNLSPLLEDVTPAQLAVLLEAIHLGDGHKENGQPWQRRSYHIVTGNKLFAERLQSLCVRRGFKCNLAQPFYNGRPAYLLHIKATDFRMVGGSTATDRPILERCDCNAGEREMVWCVTNELGTLVTRRNGKVAIVGNCIGRGTRKAPAKADCLILDVCDVSSRHKLSVQHLPEATGIAYSPTEQDELEPRVVRQHGRPVLVSEATYRPAPVQTRTVDLVLKWERVAEGRYKLALPEGTLWVAPREGGYIVGIVFRDGRKQQLTPRPVSLDWAQAFADDKARLISARSVRLVDREAAWRSRPASQKQLRKLDRWCIPYPVGCTAGEASDLIDQAMQPFRALLARDPA